MRQAFPRMGSLLSGAGRQSSILSRPGRWSNVELGDAATLFGRPGGGNQTARKDGSGNHPTDWSELESGCSRNQDAGCSVAESGSRMTMSSAKSSGGRKKSSSKLAGSRETTSSQESGGGATMSSLESLGGVMTLSTKSGGDAMTSSTKSGGRATTSSAKPGGRAAMPVTRSWGPSQPRAWPERLLFQPLTWAWLERDSGLVQLPVTVPDTITTWETEAFCVSSRGLGLAPPVQLTVFQPFFLELSLPYSIIRGEVKVTPASSSDYTLEPSSDGEYSSCLCANGRKTFKWTLIPTVLGVLKVTVSAEAEQSQTVCDNEIVSVPERGRIDTVTRSLIVQMEMPFISLTGNSVSEQLELTLPEDVIEGSARASVSVLGDILGRALKNLDGLLQMPYGCGEQNIALLAPNIYILQYLESTEQLTTAIREMATGFLKSGYQRQLNYKHLNGAYSTFGRGEGNTWLTAFVLRTFGKAQRYIFIDPEIINSAKQWLISMQRSDGCFIRQGSLFNNRMKGGVNDDVTITAYITASLLELDITVQDPVVNKGLLCLKSSIDNLKNTYTTALLAYTFSLAGENEIREQLLNKLDNVAIRGGTE
ncbi:hypothetical protein PGIGA_G00054660 [Pangasianodon gigas]|uniref:Uncharacterized protein n=1 Tax=Pangasianodon gigas TaxID=30993 RepID=A0ACC5X3D2_PANGG|nr:hypothetical protein [Pangasianodon gigas]